MEYSYLDSYKTRSINYQKLHNKIIQQFQEQGESIDKLRTYDQILFVFDERSPSGRATRGVCDQLFNQTKNRQGKTSINKMVWAYIENLETAKLCLIRDQNKSAELLRKQGSISNRHSTFVHLQIIQISVYARFTKEAILSYEIQPSNIPPVTLQNAINPVLNHEFTFRLDNTHDFSVVIMDSGINIGQWTFPDEPGLREGQYHRLVQSENLTLEAKIKYLPKDSSGQKIETNSQMRHVEGQRTNSRGAFENLVLFEPFLNNKANARLRQAEFKAAAPPRPVTQRQPSQDENDEYQGVYSVMKSHVRNLYYLLVALIICQCLFAYQSSVQFLDILLAFYLIGLLMDRRIINFQQRKIELTIICVAFIILLIKSFFGMVSYPFYFISGVKVVMSIICAILQLAVVIALAICMNNASEIAPQRNIFFYKEEEVEQFEPEPEPEPVPIQPTRQDEDDIWEDDRGVSRSKY